jgi:hypothetical protein
MIESDDLGAVPIERLISAKSKSTQEEAIERALRPRRLADYVGQAKIREQLAIFIEAARNDAATRSIMFSCSVRRVSARRRWRTSSRRDGRQPALDFRPGARARRRSGGDC